MTNRGRASEVLLNNVNGLTAKTNALPCRNSDDDLQDSLQKGQLLLAVS
jgi:hypothetical protein